MTSPQVEEILSRLTEAEKASLLAGLLQRVRKEARSTAIAAGDWFESSLKVAGLREEAAQVRVILTKLMGEKEAT